MKHRTSIAGSILAITAPVASAQTPATSGAVEFLASPPAAVYRDYAPLQSTSKIYLFRERTAFVLPAAVDIDYVHTGDGICSTLADTSDIALPAGTSVESYFFHHDWVEGTGVFATLEGAATFATPIVGVILLQDTGDTTLADSDAALGWPATIYPGEVGDPHTSTPHNNRGLEFTQPDRIQISADRLTISVRMRAEGFMDQVRVLVAAGVPAQSFCFGDGSAGACPCNNDVAIGSGTGCANSTGLGGRLSHASGENSVAQNTLALRMSNLPPGTFGLLYMGQNATQQSFADGFRCVSPGPPGSPAGSGFLRFPIQIASPQGEIVQTNVVGHMNGGTTPIIQPGSTWHFQGYYRNPGLQCNNANLTNGLTVTFY